MARTSKTTAASATLNEIATVRIVLVDSKPPIWRELEVPTSVTLEGLHDIVQIAFGWLDYHLWEFDIGGTRYGRPLEDEPEVRDAGKVILHEVLATRTTRITYIYDFGDYWEHQITVTNLRTGDPDLPYPRLVAGKMAGPPEDCGGLPGYYALLEARDDPDHPDHEDAAEYLAGYDPTELDDLVIALGLGRIVRQRNSALARRKKSGG